MIKDDFGNRRFYGIYRGIVIDNSDPKGLGRLRVQVPQVLVDTVTGWCWGTGAVSTIPPVNGGVWVMFEGGDPSYPVWVGVFGK